LILAVAAGLFAAAGVLYQTVQVIVSCRWTRCSKWLLSLITIGSNLSCQIEMVLSIFVLGGARLTQPLLILHALLHHFLCLLVLLHVLLEQLPESLVELRVALLGFIESLLCGRLRSIEEVVRIGSLKARIAKGWPLTALSSSTLARVSRVVMRLLVLLNLVHLLKVHRREALSCFGISNLLLSTIFLINYTEESLVGRLVLSGSAQVDHVSSLRIDRTKVKSSRVRSHHSAGLIFVFVILRLRAATLDLSKVKIVSSFADAPFLVHS